LTEEFESARDRWQTRFNDEVERRGERRQTFVRSDGDSPVQPLYSPQELSGAQAGEFVEDIGFPGEFPFTRGRSASGNRTYPWKLGYYLGFGHPSATNERIRQLVKGGADSAILALDLPSQHALDPDDPQSRQDVGKVGVSVACLTDLDAVFDGVDLATLGTGTVGNAIAPIMVGLFSGVGRNQHVDPKSMRVTLQNDPLKEFTGRGTQIVPIEPSIHLAGDVTEYCIREFGNWIPQYACTTQLRWSGVNAAQEIGFGIASLTAYIDEGVARGLDAAEVAGHMAGLHMTADNDLFEEVAKFRATRRLWARYAKARYDTDDPRLVGLKISVFTGGHRLTTKLPLLNIQRATVHGLAALLGGVEGLHIPAYDEALALPTEHSTRIADYTKMVLLDESNVGHSVDPLAGSYMIEQLTDALEEEALEVLTEVESAGGAVSAISEGFCEDAMVQGLLRESHEYHQDNRRVVGLNYLNSSEPEPEPQLFELDDDYLEIRMDEIVKYRASRPKGPVKRALSDLRRSLEAKKSNPYRNTVPEFMECVNTGATVGEIGQAMRDTLGEAR
jgi:methylmalonyl-CoA mutase N-terminal domain/subunit